VSTGVIPFSNNRPAVTTMTMVNDTCPSRPTHPALTDQLWTLVQRCWARDPRLFPKASEVLKVLPLSLVLIRSDHCHPFSLTASLVCREHPDWKFLIDNPLSAGERIPLVDRIFSDPIKTEVVESLSGGDAQASIDVIDEVSLDALRRMGSNVSVDSQPNPRVLPARCWITFDHRPARGVYTRCTGFVATRP